MLGSRWLMSVGPRRVSLEGVKGAVTFRFSGRFAPRPPLPERGVGELTLMAAGRLLAPAPLAPPSTPWALPDPAPPPPETAAPLFAPAAVPAFPPSGEIEMRAARFPSGIFTFGAGGTGVAERAIRLRMLDPPGSPADPTSGAAAASACASRRRAVE